MKKYPSTLKGMKIYFEENLKYSESACIDSLIQKLTEAREKGATRVELSVTFSDSEIGVKDVDEISIDIDAYKPI